MQIENEKRTYTKRKIVEDEPKIVEEPIENKKTEHKVEKAKPISKYDRMATYDIWKLATHKKELIKIRKYFNEIFDRKKNVSLSQFVVVGWGIDMHPIVLQYNRLQILSSVKVNV